MNLKKIFYLILLSLTIPSLAIFADGVGSNGIVNPTDIDGDLASMIKMMINGVLQLAIPFIVLAIIYVGFLFVKAQGDPKELESAKKALIWVLVGTAIVIGANTIYSVVEDTVEKANMTKTIINNPTFIG